MSTRQKMDRILQSPAHLGLVRTLGDVYGLMGQLSEDVLDIYPHIACRSKCNTCCKGTSMPVASPTEWLVMLRFLQKEWSEEQRKSLVQRVLRDYTLYKEAYWAVHNTIQAPPSLDKAQTFVNILQKLNDSQCPFLVDEVCSAYRGRPAKCRAHGSFLFVLDEHVQMHACADEVEKMEAFVNRSGTRRVALPIWNHFEAKIVQDFNPKDAVSTILPIWVISHLDENGQLLEDAELHPNFQAVKDRDYSDLL